MTTPVYVPSVISGADYVTIADDLAYANEAVLSSLVYQFETVQTIVYLNVVEPEVDLLNSFWQNYLGNVSTLSSNTLLSTSVSALQQHVITSGSYLTVNDYLGANLPPGTLLPYAFYQLSVFAGFPFSTSYVQMP